VIALYPVALALAAVVAVAKAAERDDRRGGWRWFVAWCAAGALLGFSFLTGLSIGLVLFPFAVVLLFVVAWWTPALAEMLGLLAGVGLVLLLVAAVNRDGHAVDPGPWLLTGIFACALAVGAYAIVAADSP
jgi:hypothetical protein